MGHSDASAILVNMRRLARLALACLATVLLAVGCSSAGNNGPLLHTGSGAAWAALPNVPRGKPYVFSIYPLCVDKGKVTVTRVRLNKPRGPIRLLGWGIRLRYPGDPYSPSDIGAGPGQIDRLPGFSHQPVQVKCSDKRHTAEFDVNVEATGPARVAQTRGFVVDYRSDRDTRRVINPYIVSLCSRKCPPNANHPLDGQR